MGTLYNAVVGVSVLVHMLVDDIVVELGTLPVLLLSPAQLMMAAVSSALSAQE